MSSPVNRQDDRPPKEGIWETDGDSLLDDLRGVRENLITKFNKFQRHGTDTDGEEFNEASEDVDRIISEILAWINEADEGEIEPEEEDKLTRAVRELRQLGKDLWDRIGNKKRNDSRFPYTQQFSISPTANGTCFFCVVPAQIGQFKLKTISYKLVTDASGIERSMYIKIRIGGVENCWFWAWSDGAGGGLQEFHFNAGIGLNFENQNQSANVHYMVAPLPDLVLDDLALITFGVQDGTGSSGDVLSEANVMLEFLK